MMLYAFGLIIEMVNKNEIEVKKVNTYHVEGSDTKHNIGKAGMGIAIQWLDRNNIPINRSVGAITLQKINRTSHEASNGRSGEEIPLEKCEISFYEGNTNFSHSMYCPIKNDYTIVGNDLSPLQQCLFARFRK